jgi:hypothetical protein
MNIRLPVPDYLTSRKNTIIQVVFTAFFAFIFIIIYRPFGYDNWYGNVGSLKLMLGAAVVILLGMFVIILTRIGMFLLKRNHEITLGLYIFLIVTEILLLGLFYTTFEIFILHDQRAVFNLYFNAVQNTSLILLIPYSMTILFFAWNDIKRKLEQVVQQFRDPSEIFIPIKDENGILRMTLRSINMLYFEANDNYVVVHYLDNGKMKTYLVRNNLKKMDSYLKDYPIFRCHRSFSVNIKNVKMVMRGKNGFEIIIQAPYEISIPVSRSYEKKILDLLKIK